MAFHSSGSDCARRLGASMESCREVGKILPAAIMGEAMQPAIHVSVTIARSAAEAYASLAAPESFLQWASGLAACMKKIGDEWVAQTPEGPAKVRFSELNAYGVLD